MIVIRNPNNEGFARACNRGAMVTESAWILFLNPDCVVDPADLKALADAPLRHPEAGVIGPRLLNPDGTVYPSARIVPPAWVAAGHGIVSLFTPNNRFTRRYLLSDWDRNSFREVEWVSGAAMLVRREAFNQVGGFDEGFFMYVEDLDLCHRIRQAGWKVVYDPAPEVVHVVGASTSTAPYRMIRHHHQSALRFAWKRTSGSWKAVALPVVAAGLALRMLGSWIDYFVRKRLIRSKESLS